MADYRGQSGRPQGPPLQCGSVAAALLFCMADKTSNDLYRTMNAGFVQEMYEEYLRDPGSVDAEWRTLFENGGRGLEPVGVKPATSPGVETRTAGVPLAGTPTPMKGAAARLVANMEASLGVPTA